MYMKTQMDNLGSERHKTQSCHIYISTQWWPVESAVVEKLTDKLFWQQIDHNF